MKKKCNIYLSKLFFKTFLAFVNLFVDIITPLVISSTQIACDITAFEMKFRCKVCRQ